MGQYCAAVDATFGDRVHFIGLQGSRGRGDHTPTSDIDVVLILDDVTTADLDTYRTVLDRLPHRELTCGFFSGRAEIEHWPAYDLFQFVHDTTPYRGVTARSRPVAPPTSRAIPSSSSPGVVLSSEAESTPKGPEEQSSGPFGVCGAAQALAAWARSARRAPSTASITTRRSAFGAPGLASSQP